MISQVFQIKIPKRGKICSAGGESFAAGMEVFSVLTQEGERKDYCPNCRGFAPCLGTIHWKSKVSEKKEESPTLLEEDEARLERLKAAIEGGGEDQVAFVLALYLARKKALILRQKIVEQGIPYLLYEVRKTQEMLFVKKLDLSQIHPASIPLLVL